MAFEDIKNFDEIAIVTKQPNGEITTWYSQECSLSLIGILEVAKEQVLSDMQD